MKICILGNGIDKALCGDYDGGAERQSALIAVALSRRGHQVVVLETNASSKACVPPEGVKLVPAWSRDRGLSGLRFLTYRMPSLLKAVRDADPDIIYCRGASMYAACLMLALRGSRHRFVWHLAAQQDVEPRLTRGRTFNCSPYAWLHAGPIFNLSARMLLKYADRVICETREELDVVNRKRCDATIVPTICERMVASETTPDDVCLWVGKFTGIKGEREFLELAKTLPEIRFRAVGHVSSQFADSSLYREIISQSNIHLVGRLQHDDLMCEYPSAALLVHTAPAEGFSNVFLEAWACGRPIISLNVDPDGLLSDGGFGDCAHGSVRHMAGLIRRWMTDPKTRETAGRRAREYVMENHSVQRALEGLELVFVDACRSRSSTLCELRKSPVV